MGREFKPGDVALVRISSDMQPEVAVSSDRQWFVAGPRLGSQHGWYHDRVEVVRPLVVIDPEDREQVERLVLSITRACREDGNLVVWDNGIHVTTATKALRSLIAPPKPPEPQGLGAVVEDAEGDRWIRFSDLPGCSWMRQAMQPIYKEFAEITAVKVLSEGVS